METKVKHILLGAGGTIGKVLANELLANNESVKLISRKTHTLAGAESSKADVLNLHDLKNAIDEHSIVYLLVGLKYDLATWKDQWPKILQNVVTACEWKKAKLIFFDNVYMYGKVDGVMNENTPFNPVSRKGEVRAKLNEYLLSEINNRNINAMIARSADFYGPYGDNTSVANMFVIKKLIEGKKAQLFVNSDKPHSYTFTNDCGKALYLLACNDKSFNQVWHLPTSLPALTGEEFVDIVKRKLKIKAEYLVMKKWMVKFAGLFDSTASEAYEMLYQNEYDYIFDSSKFEKQFSFKPTPYEKGIEETISYYIKAATTTK
jgi:nucleoside-diphosphate-sugar epimerase